MDPELKDARLVGTLEIIQQNDGGFTLVYSSPSMMEGILRKRPKEFSAVAETQKHLMKKVKEAVEFQLSMLPPKQPTLIGAADHDDSQDY